MMSIPHDCPRGRKDCISLSIIGSDDNSSFFCCGQNNGELAEVASDIYTMCFRGNHRDSIVGMDKRDLTHQASVIIQALAVVEKSYLEESDWSPWNK